MKWLLEGAQTISVLCMAAAVIECVVGEGELSESLRMLSGAVIALSIVSSVVTALQNFV